MNVYDLGQTIGQVLKDHLRATGAALRDDIQGRFGILSLEAAGYAHSAAAGDPQAQANLRHLEHQAGLLGAEIYAREYNHAIETFKAVVLAVAQTAFLLLKAAA